MLCWNRPTRSIVKSCAAWRIYLAALSASDDVIPLLGDDDGGRLFYPYGNRRRFGAATLANVFARFLGRNGLAVPACGFPGAGGLVVR